MEKQKGNKIKNTLDNVIVGASKFSRGLFGVEILKKEQLNKGRK